MRIDEHIKRLLDHGGRIVEASNAYFDISVVRNPETGPELVIRYPHRTSKNDTVYRYCGLPLYSWNFEPSIMLTWKEACKALREGSMLRRVKWHPDTYISLAPDQMLPVYQDGVVYDGKDSYRDDWIVVEE